MKKHIKILALALLLMGCIGTDIVDDLIVESKVVVDNLLESLKVGDSHQFSAQYFDNTGEASLKPIEWKSSDPMIVSITIEGLATAHQNGEVTITASVADGSTITDFLLQASEVTEESNTSKTGSFRGSSGYTAVGTATLKKNENGDLILDLSSNFKTSFALGTFIYLSNSTSGSSTRSGGLELNEIKSNGAKSFNVTAKEPSVTLESYKYVIVLCKPASITFGSAELI
jgi:hypothetical protein